jgi:hypothetical protein
MEDECVLKPLCSKWRVRLAGKRLTKKGDLKSNGGIASRVVQDLTHMSISRRMGTLMPAVWMQLGYVGWTKAEALPTTVGLDATW